MHRPDFGTWLWSSRKAVRGGLAMLLAVSLALGAEPPKYATAKRELAQRVNLPNADSRLKAIDKLEDEPSIDHARLLLEVAFKSRYPDVRARAAEILIGYREDQAVVGHLLTVLEEKIAAAAKLKRKPKAKPNERPDETTGPVLFTLLACQEEEIQDKLFPLLEQGLAVQPEAKVGISLAADLLGERGDEASIQALIRLADWPAVAGDFPVRRAIQQGLMAAQDKDAVDALMKLLPESAGELRADLIGYFGFLKGEPLGNDSAAWQAWWKEARDTFEFPDVAQRGQRMGIARAAKGYYGLPLYAQRMVFVLDCSSSMAGERIVAAQRELISAIDSLDEKYHFTVVVFHGAVGIWQRELQPANSENKLKSAQFIMRQQLLPATASCDALEAALTVDAEAMYFLTDGAPTAGRVKDPPEIVQAITQANKARRMSINTIGIAPGPPGDLFDEFLRRLAEQNYGQYRRVDE